MKEYDDDDDKLKISLLLESEKKKTSNKHKQCLFIKYKNQLTIKQAEIQNQICSNNNDDDKVLFK